MHLLIANCDADTDDNASTQAIQDRLFRIIDNPKEVSKGVFEIDEGRTQIALVIWKTDDPKESVGISNQQDLERLISASIVSVYPERAEYVQNWLDGRPHPPEHSSKEVAMSYMAGWYAKDHSGDDFYRAVWDDPKIVEALKIQLTNFGAWQIVEDLVGMNKL